MIRITRLHTEKVDVMYAPEEFFGKLRRKKMPEFEGKAEGKVESKDGCQGFSPKAAALIAVGATHYEKKFI